MALFEKIPENTASYHLFDHSQPTLIFNTELDAEEENLTFVKIPIGQSLSYILDELYRRQVQAVMVEGGRRLLDRFLTANLWDEARILIGNTTFGRGLRAPVIPHPADVTEKVGDNVQLTVFNG